MRLAAKHGGGDIIAANLKAVFTHLAAACQFLPAVAEMLSGFGFHKEQIDSALDLAGVQWCLDALAERQVFVRFDGSVVSGARPSSVLEACALPWGQARKLHSGILDALQLQALSSLRGRFVHGLGDAGSERALARLHSCTGEVSSRWLTEFPASWWPRFGDDKFLMAIRIRLVYQSYQKDIHASIRNARIGQSSAAKTWTSMGTTLLCATLVRSSSLGMRVSTTQSLKPPVMLGTRRCWSRWCQSLA